MKQWKLFVILLIVSIGSIIVFALIGNSKHPLKDEKKQFEHGTVYDVTRAVDDKSYWLFDAEGKLAKQAQQQENLLKQIEEIRQSIDNDTVKEKKGDSFQDIQKLRERIIELENKLMNAELHAWETPESPSQKPLYATATKEPLYSHLPETNYYEEGPAISGQNINSLFKTPEIFSETLVLAEMSEAQTKHIDNYIPANTYASAVLLNGADVSTGISSQTNPQPLTLQITDNGSLPNHHRGKLHDCRVSVAAHGDLSSERVFMRLEKLTCVDSEGYAIETDVEGNVVGKDGKNGIRGRMAIRDGEMLKRGFMGGFLSGLGKATAQSFGTTTFSSLGTMSTLQGAEMLKSAGTEGVGSAFELLARYNIQRAEQYQPVIQISGGESVHIVFNRGTKLGEKRVKKEKVQLPPTKPKSLWGEVE